MAIDDRPREDELLGGGGPWRKGRDKRGEIARPRATVEQKGTGRSCWSQKRKRKWWLRGDQMSMAKKSSCLMVSSWWLLLALARKNSHPLHTQKIP